MNLSPILNNTPPLRLSGGLQSAEVALRLISDAQSNPPDTAKPGIGKTDPGSETGMAALLRYARQAQHLAKPVVVPEVLPKVVGGGFTDTGWSRSEVLDLADLAPDYAAEAASLGATRVVRQSPPALSDAEFQAKASAFLDDSYADDPAYKAARDDGLVSISRISDLGFTDDFASFELYRGNEYIGSMGMGIGDPAFETYWADQNAAGTYLMVGAVDGYSVVASWAMTPARRTIHPTGPLAIPCVKS